MLPKEITEEHEYASNYHNFCTRRLDKKTLIISLWQSLQTNSAILLTDARSIWNAKTKEPYRTSWNIQLLFQI